MDRIFFRIALLMFLLAAVFAGLWWSGRAPKVPFRVEGAGFGPLRAVHLFGGHGPFLSGSPSGGAPIGLDGGEALLAPGFYLLDRSGEPARPLPVLLLEGRPLSWKFPLDPPAGTAPLPPGPFLRGPSGPVASTDSMVYARLTEVSVEEYREFLAAVAERGGERYASGGEFAEFSGPGPLIEGPLRFDGVEGDLPVNLVTWYEALAFAAYWTETRGGGRFRFRLPTSLEWEKLATGVDGRVHPWGNEPEAPLHLSQDHRGLLPVDSHPHRCSPYGAYHMEGNVAEWTMDGAGLPKGWRMVKGRSLDPESNGWRAAMGIGEHGERRARDIGFRLVAEPLP